MPVTSYILPATNIFFTVIAFWVRVPVLSEQITVVQPRVSTAGNFLIIAFLFIIRCTPKAKATVTMAGNPSGIAATAKLIPAMHINNKGSPFSIPILTNVPKILIVVPMAYFHVPHPESYQQYAQLQ